ncbi:Uncharacterised protein [Pseudomonas putida]|nr:Uncharacterised protein [Pseudomonas putida]
MCHESGPNLDSPSQPPCAAPLISYKEKFFLVRVDVWADFAYKFGSRNI